MNNNTQNQNSDDCKCMKKGSKMISEVADLSVQALDKTKSAIMKKCISGRLDDCYTAIGRKYYSEIASNPPEPYRQLVDAVNRAKCEMDNLTAK